MSKAKCRRWMSAGTLAVCLALVIPTLPVQAQMDEKFYSSCESTISSSLKALKPIAEFSGTVSSSCLDRQGGIADLESVSDSTLLVGHTISDLLWYAPWREESGTRSQEGQDFALRIGGGVELLANHINVVSSLVDLILTSEDVSTTDQEWILRLGDFASVVAKADFIQGLMPYLVQNLLSSDFPLPTDEGDITLTFNLKSGFGGIDIGTVLQGTTLLHPGSGLLDLLDLEQVTVKISNGTIGSEADLNPQDWSLQGGKVNLNLDFGANSISSTTVFSKGHGLEKQVLVLTAQLGNVNLMGQATFASSLQEFKLQANLADLLTVSTLLTPSGLANPTFGFDITIPFIKKK